MGLKKGFAYNNYTPLPYYHDYPYTNALHNVV